ncbi:MAG: lipase [Deltaproteobacteria bacterium]|jgi:pimeloyl-ACP methyl ester carboxylesterase|nr:lipase [Deltaproteobacteria bacterium]
MVEGLKAALAVLLALVVPALVLYFWFPGFILDGAKKVLRRQAGLTRHRVQVDDHRWVYLEGGRGETILFVHGFGMEKDGWGLFLKAFSNFNRLIVPDLPGFGENSRLESANYDVLSQVKRLNRFVESLGLNRFHLVGSSMGGYIAGFYASEYPEKVKSLALFNPAGVSSRDPSDLWRRYAETGELALLYKTKEGFEDLLALLLYRVPPVPGPFKNYFAELGASNYVFYGKVLRDLERGGMHQLEPRLPRVQARTLVLWGANDRILHVSGAERFREGLKNVKVVILDQCGHAPFFEKRKETTKVYQDFLADLK